MPSLEAVLIMMHSAIGALTGLVDSQLIIKLAPEPARAAPVKTRTMPNDSKPVRMQNTFNEAMSAALFEELYLPLEEEKIPLKICEELLYIG